MARLGTKGTAYSDIERKAALDVPGERYDDNIGLRGGRMTVSVNNTSYEVYKWGLNNKLANEMIALLRSNGDVGNLLDTYADFLFGSGIGIFRRHQDGKDLVLEPVVNTSYNERMLEETIPEFVEAFGTSITEAENAFVNVSNDTNRPVRLHVMDPLTVRCEKLKDGKFRKERFLVSGNWEGAGTKKAAIVPAFDFADVAGQKESILHLHRFQPGQFYYGYARWWAAAEWIKLANRIPKFHNNGLDTENNLGFICRIASEYFDAMFDAEGIRDDETKQEAYRKEFYKMVDDLLANQEGKLRVIYDEVPITHDGKLGEWIRFDPIPRKLTGKEYTELYTTAVTAFANASGILAGLAGVSGDKMLGGSGSELRVSAEYQQFFRTPRKRMLILNLLNRVLKKAWKLKEDEFFDFKNIVLETLDQNPTGAKQVKSNSL